MRLKPNSGSANQLQMTWGGYTASQPQRSTAHEDNKLGSSAKAASRFVCGAGAAVVAFLVGTGGLLTAIYVAERNDRGYRFNEFEYQARVSTRSNTRAKLRSPLDDLKYIQDVYNASTTELASFFGVSRQSIYNWHSGQPIADYNERLLEQLASAAGVLESEGLAGNHRALRRNISSGKTLFELVREGSSGESAARSLVAIIEHEVTQREAMTARLKGRARRSVDLQDIGTDHLDDRA